MTVETKELAYKILYPVSVLVVTPFVIAWASGKSIQSMLFATIMVMFIGMLPTWITYQKLIGHPKQTVLTSLSGIIPFSIVYFLIRNDVPENFLTGVLACVVGLIVCAVFDYYKSISLHVALVAGCTLVAILSSEMAGLIIGVLSLASNWCVLVTHRTTVNETLRTWAIVAVCTLCVFSVF